MTKPAHTPEPEPPAPSEVPFTRKPLFAYLVASTIYLTILTILVLSAVV